MICIKLSPQHGKKQSPSFKNQLYRIITTNCSIESLEPLSDETEDEMMLREALEDEAVKVIDRMEKCEVPLPFDHCRLGAIQRKVTH